MLRAMGTWAPLPLARLLEVTPESVLRSLSWKTSTMRVPSWGVWGAGLTQEGDGALSGGKTPLPSSSAKQVSDFSSTEKCGRDAPMCVGGYSCRDASPWSSAFIIHYVGLLIISSQLQSSLIDSIFSSLSW